jgi:hypothetical protein
MHKGPSRAATDRIQSGSGKLRGLNIPWGGHGALTKLVHQEP